MRILVVTLGRRGGVAEYGWLMSRALTACAEVAVINSSFAENEYKWAALDCRRLSVPTYRGVGSLLASVVDVRRLARIARFARAFHPDVVYYPGVHPWKPLLDFLLPRSAATVLTVHDPQVHPGQDSLGRRLLQWSNTRRVRGYVLLNRQQHDDFVVRYRLDSRSVAVIPHGLFDDHPSAEESGSLSTIHGVRPADLSGFLLFIGRIRPYKGIDTLLEAYRTLAPAEAGSLVIAGSGNLSRADRKALAGLGDRPITFVNAWLSDAEVAALVSAARFVVLPYRSATQSGVIPLASAFGVPAIASATDGLVDQVVDGRTGMLFAPGDATALRARLAEAYAMDDEAYRRMSAECREYALAHWSWPSLASRLVCFCETLVRPQAK